MPFISIGIPAYNATNFLEFSVQSVREQTLSDWELIIVNDGSKDHTGDLAEKLAAGDHRIRVVHQQNQGLSATRNTAMATMRDSEYAIFLDHDDVWKPELLSTLTCALQGAESAVGAYCLADFIDIYGNPLEPGSCEMFMRNRRRIQHHSTVALPIEANTGFDCLAIANIIPTPGQVLLRRKVLAAVGEWDERLYNCEDYEMWLRMSLIGEFVMVNHVLFSYRRHQSNMSGAYSRMRQGDLIARKTLLSSPALDADQRRILKTGYRIYERECASNKFRQVPDLLAHGQVKDAAKDMGRAAVAFWRSVAGISM